MRTRLDVLIVTANVDSAWYVGAGLARRGFAVQLTEDAEAAIQSATDNLPDAIILDFATPGVDGASLARTLRELPRGGKAPLLFVAVNAHGTDSQVRATAGIHLSLCSDGAGVGAVLVGVLTRFRDFLADLHGRRVENEREISVPMYRSQTRSG